MFLGLRKIIVVISVFSYAVVGFGQTERYSYAVKFTDKNNLPFSLNHPEDFLSKKTIERRLRFNIGFDEYDLPVNPSYITQVEQLCHCSVANKSKWFNTVTLRLSNDDCILAIEQLPFVKDVQLLGSYANNREDLSSLKLEITDEDLSQNNYSEGMYGKGLEQIEMLNGHLLHELGFDGTGIDLAVLDAGFTSVEKLPVFENLRNDGRIKMTRDFAFGTGSEVYSWSSHGTSVLSIMAADLIDSLIGTAPKANYFLFRTENVTSETPEEEYNWAGAAELCDSLGIDILNTSLGYSQFEPWLLPV